MSFSNSPLVEYTHLVEKHSGRRTQAIDRITPHCVVGQCTAESLGAWFDKPSTQASSNYGIDRDGRVALYVAEENRSWCTSSGANDQRAVTIECASDSVEPFAFRAVVYERLIELCADICRRNGKSRLLWLEDKERSLSYVPRRGEMVLTVHRWFANKSCPGNWMFARMGELARLVTERLQEAEAGEPVAREESGWYRVRRSRDDAAGQLGAFRVLANARRCADQNPGYRVFDESGALVYEPEGQESFVVRVAISNLNIRKGPGTNFDRLGFIPRGIYTIVEVREGTGATVWGRLKSGAGWISLDYVSLG